MTDLRSSQDTKPKRHTHTHTHTYTHIHTSVRLVVLMKGSRQDDKAEKSRNQTHVLGEDHPAFSREKRGEN